MPAPLRCVDELMVLSQTCSFPRLAAITNDSDRIQEIEVS